MFFWLVRLPVNTEPPQSQVDCEKGEGVEQAKQTWRNNFRVLQGGKDG